MKLYFYLSEAFPSEDICISPSHPEWRADSFGSMWWHDNYQTSACGRATRRFLRAAKAKNVTRPEHLTMVQIVQGKITTDAWEATE